MAKDRFEEDDPFEMVGVGLPQAMDDDALVEMGCCFVEELARMGYRGEKLMRIFGDPFYQGPGEAIASGRTALAEDHTRLFNPSITVYCPPLRDRVRQRALAKGQPVL